MFIDDNHLNLEEAKYYSSSLHVKSPEAISKLLNHISLNGKNDKDHSRLKQYKILEKKYKSSLKYDDNKSFLRDSKIQIEIIEGKRFYQYIDRIVELIERTNQLNFTKIRSSKDEIEHLLKQKKFKSALVKVIDKFGDYGIVGFYSINIEKHALVHFVFSCRILNIGVAQYIYALINFPTLNIIPEIAENLDNTIPDWICKISKNNIPYENNITKQNNKTKKVLFKGGCDLSQMVFYLENRGFKFIEETNYNGKNNFPIHQEHTQVLLDSFYLSTEEKSYIQNHNAIPFVDNRFYNTKIFTEKYDCLIYSVLMDYTQELYKHNSKGIILPFGGYYLHWTDKENRDKLLDIYLKSNIKIKKEIFSNFSQEFTHIGQITPEKFTNNLRALRALIPKEILIIFLNGAELESPSANEVKSKERHILMNKALDDFINKSENTYLLDIRKFITNENQLTNNLRHYNRKSYRNLSIELLKLLNECLDKKIKGRISKKSCLKEVIIKVKFLFLGIIKKAYRKMLYLILRFIR